MNKFIFTFTILLIFSFGGYFILDDRVASFRVAELLDLLGSNQSFTNRSSDFHIYARIVYYFTFGLYSIIGERLSCLLVNTFLVSFAIIMVNKYIFKNNFSVLPGSVIYPFNGSIYFYYFSFNLPLLVYLSSSLRDSFLFSVTTLFSLLLTFGGFKFSLNGEKLLSLSLSFLLFYLIIQTRPQLSIIILFAAFLTYFNVSILNILFKFLIYLKNLIKLRFFINLKIRKKILISISAIFLAILICFPIASNFVNKLNAISGDITANINLVEGISNYQVRRISRNDDSAKYSSDVIQNTDEYKNMNFVKRITLQSLNLIMTPLNFKFKFFHILSIFDSIIGILFLYLFFYRIISLNIDLEKILKKCPLALYSSNFALVSFAAYSILISNGGNAFRYKQHWLPFLMLSFGQILYFWKKNNKKFFAK